MKSEKLAKIARITLALYAVGLTAVTVLAFTVGPLKDSVPLWVKIRAREVEFRELQRKQNSMEEERDRLLATIKSLRADWATNQETIRVLRESAKDPEMAQKLVIANQLVDRLDGERSVLILKLKEFQERLRLLEESQQQGAGK